MTQEIQIEQPHGFMQDSQGRICLRFGGWDTEQTHTVPDYVEDVKYVAGPAAHKQPLHPDYKNEP